MRRLSFLVAVLTLAGAPCAAQSVETILSIGEPMGADEYTFGVVVDAAIGPGGEIWVLDGQAGIVRVYDAAGRHLRAFGRRGEGPGEFTHPVRLVVGPTEVTVYDAGQRRASRFDHYGRHLGTARHPDVSSDFDHVVPLRHDYWLAANRNVITSHGVTRLMAASAASASEIDGLVQGWRRENHHRVTVFRPDEPADTLASYDHGTGFTWRSRGSD